MSKELMFGVSRKFQLLSTMRKENKQVFLYAHPDEEFGCLMKTVENEHCIDVTFGILTPNEKRAKEFKTFVRAKAALLKKEKNKEIVYFGKIKLISEKEWEVWNLQYHHDYIEVIKTLDMSPRTFNHIIRRIHYKKDQLQREFSV